MHELDMAGMSEACTNISGLVVNLNDELVKLREELSELKTTWNGGRYNDDIADPFNAIVPDLNSLLKTIVVTLPENLKADLTKYINFNHVSGEVKVPDIPQNITNIDVLDKNTDLTYSKFDPVTAGEAAKNSKNYLNTAKQHMEDVNTQLNSFTWESSLATETKDAVRTFKGKVTESFDNIANPLNEIIQEAVEAAQNL